MIKQFLIQFLVIILCGYAYAQTPYNFMSEKPVIIIEPLKRRDITDLKNEAGKVLKSRFALQANDFKLEWLFKGSQDLKPGPNFDLARFFLLSMPNTTYGKLEINPFDLSYTLSTELKLVSAEPDLPYSLVQRIESAVEDKKTEPKVEKPIDRAWSLRNMHVQEAWNLKPEPPGKRYGKNILIGHPDTGYSDHDDLDQSRLKIDLGYDFVEDKQDPKDPLNYKSSGYPGHGLATGSVMISEGTINKLPPTDNEGGTGPPGKVTGVAPEAYLVPIRAIKSVIRVFPGKVARGIYHATRKECKVISLSMGGAPSRAVKATIEYAVNKNVIIIAAAGNKIRYVVYPARYKNCIAVAASNNLDDNWTLSSYGSAVVISAPGEFVYKAKREEISDPTNIVEGGNGTSYATANVAGIAALWIAYHSPEKLLNQLGNDKKLQFVFENLLKKTARTPDQWCTSQYGAGIVDALALLKADPVVVSDDAKRDTINFMEKIHFLYLDDIMSMLQVSKMDSKFDGLGFELLIIFYYVPSIHKQIVEYYSQVEDPEDRLKFLSDRICDFASERLKQVLNCQ